jgi:hypothetical protein
MPSHAAPWRSPPREVNDCCGSKPEKLNASICFPLFTQQRTSPRSGKEPDVKEAHRLMSIAEYWTKLADIEGGQRESTSVRQNDVVPHVAACGPHQRS